jgi:thiamine monophosphate kinase
MKDQDLIDAVRAHAVEHYNEDGWDYVVECWEDWEILAVVRGSNRESQAIRKVRKQVRALSDHRTEIQATEW